MALVAPLTGPYRPVAFVQAHSVNCLRCLRKSTERCAAPQKRCRVVNRGDRLYATSKSAVITAIAAPSREVETQTDRFVEREVFQWTKQWYPIVPLNVLEESQGEGFASGLPEIQRQSILGRDIVVWKDSEGKWRAVEDRCAHRLAALSLGSVQEDGTLACRYHGWCFNGRGECTHIPQAVDATSEATACSSSRSKVQAFPTLEAHGLLWVWPDDGETAWEDSAAKDPAIGAVSGPDAKWFATLSFPVSYASFIENIFDPTHLLYVHQGQQFEKGKVFSQEKAIPMSDFRQIGKISVKEGFKLAYAPYQTDHTWQETTHTFEPPGTSSLETRFPDGRLNYFDILFAPTKPGHISFFIGFKSDKSKQQKPAGGILGLNNAAKQLSKLLTAVQGLAMKLAFKILPSYLLIGFFHNNSTILNQDMVTLNSEDIALARTQKKFYLPTASDTGVTAWNSWLKQCGGEPKWFGGGSDAEAVQKYKHADLFNRWERHSKWCPSCRKSLKFLGRVDAFLSKAAVAFLGIALLLAAVRTVDPRFAVVATIAAGIAILGRHQAAQLRKKFLTSVPSTGVPEVSLQWPS